MTLRGEPNGYLIYWQSQHVCDALFDSGKIRIKHWNIDPAIHLESFPYMPKCSVYCAQSCPHTSWFSIANNVHDIVSIYVAYILRILHYILITSTYIKMNILIWFSWKIIPYLFLGSFLKKKPFLLKKDFNWNLLMTNLAHWNHFFKSEVFQWLK